MQLVSSELADFAGLEFDGGDRSLTRLFRLLLSLLGGGCWHCVRRRCRVETKARSTQESPPPPTCL